MNYGDCKNSQDYDLLLRHIRRSHYCISNLECNLDRHTIHHGILHPNAPSCLIRRIQ